jgi:PadR family transcriptional regulator PadR
MDRGQALKGHLDLLLLAALADGAKHGYAVIDALRDRSDRAFELPEGTVYPALHRLERAGYLSSEWSEVQGRRRRTYRLTDEGRSALHDERRAWDEFSDAIAGVLRRSTWSSTS